MAELRYSTLIIQVPLLYFRHLSNQLNQQTNVTRPISFGDFFFFFFSFNMILATILLVSMFLKHFSKIAFKPLRLKFSEETRVLEEEEEEESSTTQHDLKKKKKKTHNPSIHKPITNSKKLSIRDLSSTWIFFFLFHIKLPPL